MNRFLSQALPLGILGHEVVGIAQLAGRRGERTLRRLLIVGASAVVHHASRRNLPAGSWLAQLDTSAYLAVAALWV